MPSILNRAAVWLVPKQPFIDWINSTGGEDCDYTVEEIARDCTAYLLPPFELSDRFPALLRQHFKEMFEQELFAWSTDLRVWPRNRSFAVFNKWFQVHVSSMVIDLEEGPLDREEM